MIDLIKQSKVISIVGMGKNVGKTTTLNYLISSLPSTKIGLTSIGYDGEDIDTITNKPKPKITVLENTIFATATTLLKHTQLDFDILVETKMNTPLGEVVLVRAKSSGNVILAGPSMKSQIKEIIDLFWGYNVEKIFIDGAFGKMVSTDASLVDATILATGLAYHPNIDKIVNDTIYRAHLYQNENLYKVQDEEVLIISDVIGNELEKAKQIDSKMTNRLNGALTDRFINEILYNSSKRNLKFILDNPTMCFVSNEVAQKALLRNINIYFANTTKLLAITINPTSPHGLVIDSNLLKEKLASKTNIPVFDVMKE